MRNRKKIYCCGCLKEVFARLTSGVEVYPHRNDLAKLPFWICDTCKNFIGCHHKTKNKTKPLGCIATSEIKNARIHIHKLLDPLWVSGEYSRSDIYKHISKNMNLKSYHTGELKTIEDCRKVYRILLNYIREKESN